MKRKTDNFNKFFNKKRNSAVKEQFKQEKKAAKKERKEAIERHFEEKRQARWQNQPRTEQYSRPGAPKKDGAPHAGKPAKTGPGSIRPAHAAAFGSAGKNAAPGASGTQDPNLIPLNKYIAHGGICSRRDAAELIKQGKVLVNGQPVTEPGTKVSPDDLVKVNGKKVTISRNFVYILLNKPKDYITTTDDPQGRRTVLDLTRQATQERVFPVGRLDRNTSGVLLLTNDGDLAQKLAHPKHEIKKIYHVSLDKALTKADFDKIIGDGVVLEDGIANVDVLAYADPKDKTQIGLEIHSGRNRIVRRIFEHLGYDVRGLDRVMYAGLTKKNVQRGKWRLLTEKEIRILKYLNSAPRSVAQTKAMQAEKTAYRDKKSARDRDVDEFLENDIQPDEFSGKEDFGGKKNFRSVASAKPAPFRKKGPGKSFGPAKEAASDKHASPDKPKPAFGNKRPSPDRAGKPDFGGKKKFGGKTAFTDKKDSGKEGFSPDRSFSRDKKEFGDKKNFKAAAPGKTSFRDKSATPGKTSFRDKSAAPGKPSFRDKRSSPDKAGFAGKRSSTGKKSFQSDAPEKDFSAGKKAAGKSFGPGKEGFAGKRTSQRPGASKGSKGKSRPSNRPAK